MASQERVNSQQSQGAINIADGAPSSPLLEGRVEQVATKATTQVTKEVSEVVTNQAAGEVLVAASQGNATDSRRPSASAATVLADDSLRTNSRPAQQGPEQDELYRSSPDAEARQALRLSQKRASASVPAGNASIHSAPSGEPAAPAHHVVTETSVIPAKASSNHQTPAATAVPDQDQQQPKTDAKTPATRGTSSAKPSTVWTRTPRKLSGTSQTSGMPSTTKALAAKTPLAQQSRGMGSLAALKAKKAGDTLTATQETDSQEPAASGDVRNRTGKLKAPTRKEPAARSTQEPKKSAPLQSKSKTQAPASASASASASGAPSTNKPMSRRQAMRGGTQEEEHPKTEPTGRKNASGTASKAAKAAGTSGRPQHSMSRQQPAESDDEDDVRSSKRIPGSARPPRRPVVSADSDDEEQEEESTARSTKPLPKAHGHSAPEASKKGKAVAKASKVQEEQEEEDNEEPPARPKRGATTKAPNSKELVSNSDDEEKSEELDAAKRQRNESSAQPTSSGDASDEFKLSSDNAGTKKGKASKKNDAASQRAPRMTRPKAAAEAKSKTAVAKASDATVQTTTQGKQNKQKQPEPVANRSANGKEPGEPQKPEKVTNTRNERKLKHTQAVDEDLNTNQDMGMDQPGSARQKQSQPLGSQNNPVELSDGEPKSSSIVSTPSTDRNSNDRDAAVPSAHSPPKDIQTPAVVPSSPPAARHASVAQIETHKTTIIAFDKHGPRNQGSMPANTPGTRTGRSSLPPVKVPLAAEGQHGGPMYGRSVRGSSVATSARTARSQHRVKPSNVAGDVSDALAMFEKPVKTSIHKSTAVPEMAPKLQKAAHGNKATSQTENAEIQHDDDGYTNIDDLEGDTFVVGGSSQPKQDEPPKEAPTASQLAMPPPPKVVAGATVKRRITQQSPDAVDPKPARKLPTASRAKRSLTPEPSTETMSKRAKVVAIEANAVVNKSNGFSAAETSVVCQKRARAADMPSEPSPKRAKTTISHQGPSRSKARADNSANDVVDPKHKAPGESRPDSVSKSHPASRGKTKAPAVLVPEVSRREASKYLHRRPARHISQGSQTVDVNGSPVPPDMDVTHRSTVLDAYSQQTALVSDQGTERRVQRELQTTRVVVDKVDDDLIDYSEEEDQSLEESDPYSAPPSRQPEVVSSNRKILPASAFAVSKSISVMRVTDSASKKLLQKDNSIANLVNPFTSSGDSQSTGGSDTYPATAFTKKLRDSGADTKSYDMLPAKTTKEHSKPLNVASVSRPSVRKQNITLAHAMAPLATTSRRAQGGRSKPAVHVKEAVDEKPLRDVTKQANKLRSHAVVRRISELWDDTTLVNNDEDDEESEYDAEPNYEVEGEDETSIRSSEASPVASRDASRSPSAASELSQPLSDDLRASWYGKLLPHQMDFHKELLKTVDEVVQRFVEGENSLERFLQEDHQARLHMVDSGVKQRVKEYTSLLKDLELDKRRKKKDMKQATRDFDSYFADVAATRKGYKERQAGWDSANRELKSFLGKLS